MDTHNGGPSALLLSRQNLPFVARDASTVAAISRGGSVLRDAPDARAVIIATGSEVELDLGAQERLDGHGIAERVVSMACTSLVDEQDQHWRGSGLPAHLPRVGV